MSIAQATETVWALPPNRTLHIRLLDDQAIVYDEASGDTHLLSASAAGLLLALRERGPQAASALSPDMPPAARDRLLVELQALGLLQSSVPPSPP